MTEAATSIPEGSEGDVRPIVRTADAGNRGVWLFAGALLVGGAVLFSALNSRRQDMVAATTLPVSTPGGMISAPAPLTLPPDYNAAPVVTEAQPVGTRPFPVVAPAQASSPQVITRTVERPAAMPPPPSPDMFPQPVSPPARAPAVIERPALAGPPPGSTQTTGENAERVMAGRLVNPGLTVPQGTVIAAVLETALDSTRAGGVRAIVSRDVRSFDGSRILIPRGSRLYGEYASDTSAGQNRALVQWHRLTRPDAVIIALDSPAADPLGRAGIRGKVNSHFLERFGGAILQSVLDIGVGVATRSVTRDGVIVALPGSTQNVTGTQSAPIPPTLTVRQGTSVSVFVARDLDFSTVEH